MIENDANASIALAFGLAYNKKQDLRRVVRRIFAAERIAKIKEILLEYKHVDINTLSSLLSVSVATVRRDLDTLESAGFLKKMHGGAMLDENIESEVQLSGVEDPMHTEKAQIGTIASKLVLNNDIIFIGAGSTCLNVARCIKDKRNITVLTNNVNVIFELATAHLVKVIALGGEITAIDASIAMTGPFALANVDNIYINKAFIPISGASITDGYTERDSNEAELYRRIMSRAEKKIIVADYTKFDKRGFVRLDNLLSAETVVTNVQLNQNYKNYFYDNNITVFTTFDEI